MIDITHGIGHRRCSQGALVLRSTIAYMPVGVHLAVVDPDVGGNRRAVAIATADGRTFVGPDNGLLMLAADELGLTAAHEITDERYLLPNVSKTFHARDIFAPAAAHLAAGVAIGELGAAVDPETLVRLEVPEPAVGRNADLDDGAGGRPVRQRGHERAQRASRVPRDRGRRARRDQADARPVLRSRRAVLRRRASGRADPLRRLLRATSPSRSAEEMQPGSPASRPATKSVSPAYDVRPAIRKARHRHGRPVAAALGAFPRPLTRELRSPRARMGHDARLAGAARRDQRRSRRRPVAARGCARPRHRERRGRPASSPRVGPARR